MGVPLRQRVAEGEGGGGGGAKRGTAREVDARGVETGGVTAVAEEGGRRVVDFAGITVAHATGTNRSSS